MMKESTKKVFTIVLPPLCIIAGILGIVFFFCGPVGKGQYDILALGAIAIAAAILAIVLIIIDKVKGNKGDKE